MWIVVYLLALPFASDVESIASPRWQVREQAAKRLESKIPWSLAAVLPAIGDQPHVVKIKSRVRTSTWLGRQVARWFSEERKDQILYQWLDECEYAVVSDEHGCRWRWYIRKHDSGKLYLIQVLEKRHEEPRVGVHTE